MITERIMAQGAFEIPLAEDAPWSLWETLDSYGHIIITSQYVDYRTFTDAAMLNAARYTGVLLQKEVTNRRLTLNGAGLVLWLGDEEGKGDIITSQGFNGSNLTTVMNALVPPSLTVGTVTNTTLYWGDHTYEAPITAIRTACAATEAEFKVNANGTIDAGPNTAVYNIFDEDISLVLTRRNYGSDPTYRGVPPDEMTSEYDSRPYASRVYLVTSNGTLISNVARQPSPTQRDLNGNIIDRGLVITNSAANPISATTYLYSELNAHSDIQEMNVSTEWFELDGGDFRVGDACWAYDPPAFYDTGNKIFFRGEYLFPIKLRIIEATWPVREGMGVFYRSPTNPAVYIDLSNWIEYETGVFSSARLRPIGDQEALGCG